MENLSKTTQFASAGELGDMFGVQSKTILAWANAGIIPCLRLSSKVIRFDIAEVEAALRERASRLEKESNKCSVK